MVRFLSFCFLFLLISYPAFSQDKVFSAQTKTLKNGLEVIVIPNHRAPVVTHMVWYKVGAADEEFGKSGIAHFMEHLMFKGSSYTDEKGEVTKLPPGEFSKIIKSIGGRDNAFTSQDYTAYYQSVPVKALERVMRMEAGRMRSMLPPLEEVVSENAVILEERSQRTDNDPRAAFGENMKAALFINHPYGVPVIGWRHEMEKLDWDAAKTFYDRYYAPNNAILVVAGDVKPEEVFDLAEEIYGGLKPSDAVQDNIVIPQSPPIGGRVEITETSDQIDQDMLHIGLRVPGYRQNEKEAFALEVLSDILGQGPTSRLYKDLVIDQKLATQAGISYDPVSRYDGTIWVYAVPAEGVGVDKLLNGIEAVIHAVREEGISEEKLKESITHLQDKAVYALDSLQGGPMILGQAVASGVDLDVMEYWPSKLGKVTKEDVDGVLKKYLDFSGDGDTPVVIGYLLKKQQEEKTEAAE